MNYIIKKFNRLYHKCNSKPEIGGLTMPATIFTKPILKCERCGKIIPEKHWLIQDVEYLGETSPRIPICEECHESLLYWLDEIKKFKEKLDGKHIQSSEY